MIVQFAIVVLARLWTCYGEHPSIRSKSIIKHSFSSKVLGQNKEKESSLSHMLGAQDDYSDRNGGLSIEFLLLSRVEVRAEEGSGDIPRSVSPIGERKTFGANVHWLLLNFCSCREGCCSQHVIELQRVGGGVGC